MKCSFIHGGYRCLRCHARDSGMMRYVASANPLPDLRDDPALIDSYNCTPLCRGSSTCVTKEDTSVLHQRHDEAARIVTPTDAQHVQAAVLCGRRHGVRLRVRSGGHDYEGLSYRSPRPNEVFGVLDLANLRSVSVNRSESTAWVESGATLGELYYAIAKNNSELAFPAGECPTVGVGGQFSGGGIGMMMRKYELSIDNVLDAKMVNANGDLRTGTSWGGPLRAIRGGGGESRRRALVEDPTRAGPADGDRVQHREDA
ncbi:hypothetical protein QYE76_020477 [Lolium multiflorum]|uniref:FAD-binding PCMH-type domain-containing protein n=1 Tax=Lolium multiflorum TaxID=4521 RepID=A0AAD8VRX2_LOLMU|nr:hypothetical protein QYE76_020477 [Lolium multiflorum]